MEKQKYLEIIKNAKKEMRFRGNGNYYEEHHILPKVLFPLWATRKSNLILLTAKEHIICHKYLAKIYGGTMWCAYNRLATDKKDGHELTPEEYEELKLNFSNLRKTDKKWNAKISKGNTGKIRTQEQKDHHSKIMTGKKLWPNGRQFSEEHKNNLSKGQTGIQKPNAQKKVICLETKYIYYVTEANNLFNIRVDEILKKESQEYYQKEKKRKLHWAYYDETKNDEYWNKLLVNLLNKKRKCLYRQARYKCLETNEIFIGNKQLLEKYNTESIASFNRHLRGDRENFCGFHFIRMKSQY